ncbi:hypothetical protein Cni_G22108 [Canna indica]|uniref:Uncharacterized protein n=1 Tax=Canna indica TaxID=4628 RepID=A0AAQ3KQU4_9LILI|nr:hypothetical protein Cni_G22108 [Canna indica]
MNLGRPGPVPHFSGRDKISILRIRDRDAYLRPDSKPGRDQDIPNLGPSRPELTPNEHRAVENGESREDMDFVDVLLSLPDEDGNEHMDDVDIKALIHDMIAVATDMSSVMNEWAMTEMIKTPRVLEKVQEELDMVVGQDRLVQEANLGRLTYLWCIIRETFRMHLGARSSSPTNP